MEDRTLITEIQLVAGGGDDLETTKFFRLANECGAYHAAVSRDK